MTFDPIDIKAAEATLPDSRFVRRARAYITSEQVMVWGETTDRRSAELVFSQRTYAIVTNTLRDAGVAARAHRVEVMTDAGLVILRPTGGCGCGPLARIRPNG